VKEKEDEKNLKTKIYVINVKVKLNPPIMGYAANYVRDGFISSV